eukprot:GHVU01167987.1.p4 GENE.GHVU01167987.1~~GHVU01167987.1.p4  ORF type:complete len:119 (+),score=25.61 GHVU01167987.1:1172-1528(+)
MNSTFVWRNRNRCVLRTSVVSLYYSSLFTCSSSSSGKCGPLRRLLQKPELRAMLEEVDGSANRVAALAAVLQDPLLDVFTHVVMRALEEEDIPEDDESEAAMKTWLASVCEEAEDLSK